MNIEIMLPKLSTIVKEEWDKSNTPGLAVGIVHEGKLVQTHCLGKANLETQKKVDIETTFMLGSITKPFTTIALMQLYEKGKFELDDPINKYLPEDHGKIFTKKGWPEVTFRHILTHNSGIGELRLGRDLFIKGFKLITYDDTPTPPLKEFHKLKLKTTAPAGQKYAYSNVGYSILGYIVEIISGMPYEEYIVKNIMDPLGMSQSDVRDVVESKRIGNTMAQGYKFKKGDYIKSKRWNNIIKPSGSLLSNLKDMAKFATMLINKGKLGNVQIIKPEIAELMWKPHYASHESFKNHYYVGFDFSIYVMNGIRVIEHTGGIGGFTSVFTILPDLDMAFLIYANFHQAITKRVTKKIRNRFLKLLTGIPSTADAYIDEKMSANKSYWPMIKGYYGNYPGWLSSTRIYLDAGDYKIFEKDGSLWLSSFYKDLKKPVRLYPTENPLVYQYKHESAASDIFPTTRVGFTLNKKQNDVKEMAKHEFVLRKMNLYSTMRFKIYVWIVFIIIAIILAIFL